MNCVIVLSLLCLAFHIVTAPPPRRNEHQETKEEKHENQDELGEFNLEYDRYLKEVVDLLDSDPEFKKKLANTNDADIRNGKIAEELEFVDHKVRTKLDELKRQELERLRHLAQKQYELNNGIDTDHMKISSEHLDHENPHTFEMEDLKKLIFKASADLDKVDEKRRQKFKEYEMQKEFEKQEKLKHLQGSEKEAFEKQIQENETKHKQHEPLHHPGSKQQLEEVWEKQDHMENQDFDPKVFFQLHDLDGNGVWDQNEVKMLFLKELDKMYEQGAPEDDMKERAEEMERMREHVFGEADKNKDGLISYEEFLEKTKQPDFERDPGWESIDQKPVYTYEEYKEFERRRQEEVQRLIQQGLIPPQPVYPDYGYHHPPQPGYGHHEPQYYQQHPQGHAQMPQGYHPPPPGHPNQHQQGYNQFHQDGVSQQHHNQGQQHNQFQQGQNYQQLNNHQQPGHDNNQNQGQHQQQNYNQQGQHNQQQYDHHQQQNYNQQGQHNQQYDHHQQQNYNQHDQQGQGQHNQQHNDHQQQNYNQHGQQKQNQQQYDHQQQQQQYQNHDQNNVNHGQQHISQGSNDHPQPGHADSKPHNVESYNAHPDPSKTGTFQKAHAELNLNAKEGKNAAQQTANHL